MPTYEITGPDGSVYEVEGQGSEQEALQHLQQQLGGAQPSPEAPAAPADRNFLNVSRDVILGPPPAEPQPYGPVDRPVPMGPMADPNIQYRTELQKLAAAKKINETLSRPMTEGSQSGLLMGFDDELAAAANAPFHATYDWWKGKGFDVGRSYTALQQQLDAQKQQRREEHPIASLTGEVAGGLALGGLAQKAGGTLMGRTVPVLSRVAPVATQTGLAALEGGIYGGIQGAGEAKPGERLAGARRGAGAGAAMGFGAQVTGNVIANRLAQRAARSTAVPAVETLKTTKNALYDASEKAGMTIKQPAILRLKESMKTVAGKVNPYNRPMTAGHVADLEDRLTTNMTLREVDEVRQSIGNDIKVAKGDDQIRLQDMKHALDDFLDHPREGDFTGGSEAVPLIKQARAVTRQTKQMEIFEDIHDKATRNASGYEEGLVTGFRALANNKKQLAQFSKLQQQFIKKITTVKNPTTWLRGLGKFKAGVAWPVAVMEMFTAGLPLTTTGVFLLSAGARKIGNKLTKAKIEAAQRAIVDAKPPARQAARNVVPLIPAALPAADAAEREFGIKRQLRSLTGG